MCGRYVLRSIDLALSAFNASLDPGFEEFTERPRFNIAPSQDIAVVRINQNGDRVLGLVRWGLIPHWARELPKVRPINARAETVRAMWGTAVTHAVFRSESRGSAHPVPG